MQDLKPKSIDIFVLNVFKALTTVVEDDVLQYKTYYFLGPVFIFSEKFNQCTSDPDG